MNTLQEDAHILLSFQAEYNRLNNYAIKCYNKKFGTIGGGVHSYKSFEIISNNQIRIIYIYGEGIVTKCESFIDEIV